MDICDSFQFEVVTIAAMNDLVQVIQWMYIQISVGNIPKIGLVMG